MMQKADIRNLKKAELNALSSAEREQKSLNIATRVLDFLGERAVGSVCVYNSFSTEVMTDYLIDRLMEKGYKVFLPRIKTKGMDVVSVDAQTEFFVNEYGISEPVGERADEKPDVIIMPLLAFDRDFNRLGRGKGYYDEFLKNQKGKRLALAFSCQEFNNLPVEELDEKLDVIITENEVLEK